MGNERLTIIVKLRRYLLTVSLLFCLIIFLAAYVFVNERYHLFDRHGDNIIFPQAKAINAESAKNKLRKTVWVAPDTNNIPDDVEGRQIKYGRALIANTSKYLGPKGIVGKIANGMNCQNCHNQAGTKAFGLNYAAVASTYPEFKARSNVSVSIAMRINGCFERSMNGIQLDSTSNEMLAMIAYMKWLSNGVAKGEKPEGIGVEKLTFLNRAADPVKGKLVFLRSCQSCHAKNGEGISNADQSGYIYPPLWGHDSYNDGAGLFRLANFAGFVKNNMPFGTVYLHPVLTDEEVWDVAAFVNSQPRPHKDQTKDWITLASKPIDFPFGPYADGFSEKQHKFGPFGPIKKAQKINP